MLTQKLSKDTLSSIATKHALPFLGGVLVVVLLFVLQHQLRNSMGLSLPLPELFTPLRMLLTGLGSGYYLFRAIKQNRGPFTSLYLGILLTLAVIFSIDLQPVSVGILILSAVTMISLGASDLIENDYFESKYSIVGLVASSIAVPLIIILQYVAALSVWATQNQSREITIAVGVGGGILVSAIVIALYFKESGKSISLEQQNT